LKAGDQVSVTYQLADPDLKRANDLLDRADQALQIGDAAQDRLLRRQAKKVVADSSNYVPSKVEVLSEQAASQSHTKYNARFLKVERISKAKRLQAKGRVSPSS
jgi:hypothetical protein